jgi:protein-L-isoaspartate(D-aspartate) O-methyltransferase
MRSERGEERRRDPRASMKPASEQERERLVGELENAGAIKTQAVREAFLVVPRETFLPGIHEQEGLQAVYRDEAYPTKTDDRGDAISSSSQPQIMASMLEALRVAPGHHVLEVGTGTGYNAALLSEIVGREGRVVSVELDPELAVVADEAIRRSGEEVEVVVGDGREGFGPGAPYDRAVVTASSTDVPEAFFEQLMEGGLLVMPLRITDSLPFQQVVVTLQRVLDGFRSVSVIRGGFMRLRGEPGDVSLPWAVTPIIAPDGEEPRGSLSGAGLGRLPDHVRGKLSALCAGQSRSLPLGMRLRSWHQWELQTFIALSLDEDLLVGVERHDLAELSFLGTAFPAVIDPDGRGIAHLAGRQTISRIDAFGEPGPDRTLRGAVDDWRSRGRPPASRLRISVAYGPSAPTRSWRAKRRGTSLITFDW